MHQYADRTATLKGMICSYVQDSTDIRRYTYLPRTALIEFPQQLMFNILPLGLIYQFYLSEIQLIYL